MGPEHRLFFWAGVKGAVGKKNFQLDIAALFRACRTGARSPARVEKVRFPIPETRSPTLSSIRASKRDELSAYESTFQGAARGCRMGFRRAAALCPEFLTIACARCRQSENF